MGLTIRFSAPNLFMHHSSYDIPKHHAPYHCLMEHEQYKIFTWRVLLLNAPTSSSALAQVFAGSQDTASASGCLIIRIAFHGRFNPMIYVDGIHYDAYRPETWVLVRTEASRKDMGKPVKSRKISMHCARHVSKVKRQQKDLAFQSERLAWNCPMC